jgi:hypothetical protein
MKAGTQFCRLMKFVNRLFLFLACLFSGITLRAQVTVTGAANTTPALAATYTSLANAITALNNITAISGPVTISLTAGNPQTAPAGGYSIQFSATTTAVNNISIVGNSNVITASNTHTAGSRTDALFKLIGVDFITLRNFTLQENAANTTTAVATNNMTEWGVALLYASTTNGAQNNTIRNNTISLNKTYGSTFGIYSNSNHTLAAPTTSAPVTATTGTNSNNKFYSNAISNVNMGIALIGCQDVNFMDTGNDVGGSSAATGNTITNWGGLVQTTSYASSTGTCYGINSDNQKDENISFNTITSAAVSGTTVTMRGIFKDFNNTPTGTFTTTISNNTITITDNFTSGTLELIRSQGIASALGTATININANSLLNTVIGGASASISFVGITNTSQCGVLNINSNIIRGTTSTATTGGFTAINNSGLVTTTVNINNNQIGNASGAAFTYSVASSGVINGITCPTVAATAAISISNNNFQGFNQTVAGSGAHNYISLTHSPSGATTNNINNNTFTNLSANTSGTITFIFRSGSMALNAGATENCNNNAIVTAFAKPTAGGNLRMYLGTGAHQSGNTQVQSGNNFSNISVTGATIVTGWINGEGSSTSAPVKTIENNTFANWNCGSAATVLNLNNGASNTSISFNNISNITAADVISAIVVGNGFNGTLLTITGNSITGLTSTGGTITGISGGSSLVTNTNVSKNEIGAFQSAATGVTVGLTMTTTQTANYFRNKIYDISGTNAGSLVYGMQIGAPATFTSTIYNNLIGDIKAPNATVDNAVVGLKLTSAAATSTYNVYYNTVYLAAVSTGTNFGSSAFFCVASGTPTSGSLTLRNNILINNSTANGTGLTVAFGRNSNSLNNYTTASNNNIFYAGTPSASNLIFNDGINSDQTLAAYKTRAATRDAGSFTELCSFLSLAGSNSGFLHLDPSVPTQAESGAVNISGFTTDFDDEVRQGNTGYSGTGTAPDIGADELEGIFTELNPPVISYTNISSPTCNYGNITITGATITDFTGIPLSGVKRPRIYYRKNSGSWFSQPGTNTAGTATNSTWSFTIVASDMGTLTGGDVISYYIIAQDNISPANVGSNPSTGLVATGVSSVTTPPTTPKTYVLLYNMSGTYTVGAGGNFTTLTAAVAAYNNACSLAGATIFELINDTYASETYPITINNHADASAINTLTIRPSATATPVFTGSPNTQLLSFNGARYITLDGRRGGTGASKSLSFVNNNPSGNTLLFINDANNNIVRHCVVRGSSNSTARGVINFSTGSAGGNSNNDINNNDIADGATTPANGILSIGTAGSANSNNTISNNNIFNFFNPINRSVAIYANTNSTGWTVTNNRIFQTSDRVYTSACDIYGMWFTDGNGYTISNNTIGFANAAGTGTMVLMGNATAISGFPTSYSAATGTAIRFIGIVGSFAAGSPASNINGNVVSGIAMYTSSNGFTTYGNWCGIYTESGDVNIGTLAGNIIGAASGTGSVYVATNSPLAVQGKVVGIRAGSTGIVNVQNNIIGSITSSGSNSNQANSITGISTGGSGTFTVSSNSIGNSTPENLKVGCYQTSGNLSNTGSPIAVSGTMLPFVGIEASSSLGNISITGNTIQGMANNTFACQSVGIDVSTSGSILGPNVSVQTNTIGNASTGWLHFRINQGSNLFGIKISEVSTGTPATFTVSDNNFTGITTESGITHGGINMISIFGSGSDNVNITNNLFSNLQLKNGIGLISSSYNITGNCTHTVSNNRIVGGLIINGNGGFAGIASSTNLPTGMVIYSNNDFSNIQLNGTGDMSGMVGQFINGSPTRTITGNTFTNWQTNGLIEGISINAFSGALSSISNNSLKNLSAGTGFTGIQLGDPSLGRDGNASLLEVSNNEVGQISSATGNITGIINYVPSTVVNIENNLVHDFSGGALNVMGISHSTIHLLDARIVKNKIYNLSSTNASARVTGIESNQTFAASTHAIVNNYVGNLFASNAGLLNSPSVRGISIAGNNAVNAYYNTIALSGNSSSSNFSSTALFFQSGPTLHVQNNIFTNASVPGASGKTVAFWNQGALGNYSAASNYNDFYAGTASASNLLYYDGSTGDQTLAAYQARVAPKDNASVTVLPAYLSTTGSDASFLHLPASGICGLALAGSSSGLAISVTSDYDGDARSNSTPFITDIGADEVSKYNVWTGANGTNWNDPLNWSRGVVPNDNLEFAYIANPPINQPTIQTGETFQVGSIFVSPEGLLTNKGTLKIGGQLIAFPAGINNVNAGIAVGSVEFNNGCSVTPVIDGSIFDNNKVNNLTIGQNLSISPNTGEGIYVEGQLNFGSVSNAVLQTGDNLTLGSSASRTASLGKLISGNSLQGKVTVERYIHTGVGGGRHLKSWQFLSAPTVGQSIFNAWQEGGSNLPGYGTWISGNGSGFDVFSQAPALKHYDPASNTWIGETNTANPVNNGKGYLLFVRGDRTVTTFNGTPVPTILRSTGNVYQPNNVPPVTNVGANQWSSVANPYASAIDLIQLRDNGGFAGLNNDVVVWDPTLGGTFGYGGYQTLAAANDYEPTAGGTTYYPAGVAAPAIQSGQAFLVRSAGGPATVQFTEAAKLNSSRLVHRPTNSNRSFFRVTLRQTDDQILDGNAVAFETAFSNLLNPDDAEKLPNATENIGIRRLNKLLSVEARKPVQRRDTIFYELQNLKIQSYRLAFAPSGMPYRLLSARLIDRFLNTQTPVSLGDSTYITFTVTNNPASRAANRFYVVFDAERSNPPIRPLAKGNTPGNVNEHMGSIVVFPNPVRNHRLQLRLQNIPDGSFNWQLISQDAKRMASGEATLAPYQSILQIAVPAGTVTGQYLLQATDAHGQRYTIPVIIE